MDETLTSAAVPPTVASAAGPPPVELPHAPTLTLGDRLTQLRYRWWPDHVLTADYATLIAAGFPDSAVWDFIGNGAWLGVPTVVFVYAIVAIFGHVFLTRLRPGWHIIAIGGSRRSAYNTGIPVRRTVSLC